jgi:hypothetical protein
MPALIWLYLTALLYDRTAATCVAMSEALQTVSHDRLTRMLHADWSGQTLLESACRMLFVWERGDLILVVSGGGTAATGRGLRPSNPAVPARVSPRKNARRFQDVASWVLMGGLLPLGVLRPEERSRPRTPANSGPEWPPGHGSSRGVGIHGP